MVWDHKGGARIDVFEKRKEPVWPSVITIIAVLCVLGWLFG